MAKIGKGTLGNIESAPDVLAALGVDALTGAYSVHPANLTLSVAGKTDTEIANAIASVDAVAAKNAKMLSDYQQAAQGYIDSRAATMQRIALALALGKCTPTDAAVVAWQTWSTNVRAEIKATSVPTDTKGNPVTVQQKYPEPTNYPAGS